MIVAVNKVDNTAREADAAEFWSLGWEETYAISASHGRGTGDLLDAIVWALPPESEAEIARKAREDEADGWARDVAAGTARAVRRRRARRPKRTRTAAGRGRSGRRPLGRGDRRRGRGPGRRDRLRRPAERRQVVAPQQPARRGPGDRLGGARHDPRRDRHDARVGPERGRPDRHRRDQAARQGRVGAGRGAVFDAALPEGDRPRRRRGPRHRRGRGADRPGRPRRGLRRRGGQGPRHRREQVGSRRGARRIGRSTSTSSGSGARCRSSTSRRSSRSARRPASGSAACSSWRSTSGASDGSAISTAELNRILRAAVERQTPPVVKGRRPEALLRDAGRRRAADVRLLRERRRLDPLQLPALPREPAARGVRLRRHADQARLPGPRVGTPAAPPLGELVRATRCTTSRRAAAGVASDRSDDTPGHASPSSAPGRGARRSPS